MDPREILQFQQSQALKDFGSALSLGMVKGAEPEVKFGYAAAISALGDVWPLGTPYVFPVDAGQLVQAVSTDVADTHELTIEGINKADGLPVSVKVTLDGTTPVAVPDILWASVHRAFNSNSVAFLGTINILGTGAPNSNVFAVVLPADQQTTQTIYQVPADKVALINNYSTALNKTAGADASAIMRLQITRPGKVARTQIRYGLQRSGTSNLSSDLIVPIPVGPGSRIQVTAEPTAEVDISGEYSMILIDKDLVSPELLAALA